MTHTGSRNEPRNLRSVFGMSFDSLKKSRMLTMNRSVVSFQKTDEDAHYRWQGGP